MPRLMTQLGNNEGSKTSSQSAMKYIKGLLWSLRKFAILSGNGSLNRNVKKRTTATATTTETLSDILNIVAQYCIFKFFTGIQCFKKFKDSEEE